MDTIQIKDLEIYCHHGVFKEENVLGQKFLVSLILSVDTLAAVKSDDITQSVNYADVSHFVKEKMQEKNYKLIEAVAHHLAQDILLKYPLVSQVTVEIKKPWAPIHLPLDTVSVSATRGWTQAYLSIGSNMGDREGYIHRAIEALESEETIKDVQISDIIETDAYGYTDQGPFLNAAIALQTMESPKGLLSICHSIEEAGGRERTIHWGPRTLDLDILMYGDLVCQSEDLIIPHIDMHNRMFVLEPLSQIAPWKIHPVYHKTVRELYDLLKERDR